MNSSSLMDLTAMLKECAAEEFGLDLSRNSFSAFGKFEMELPAGSVKTRPAMQIARDAIGSGKLRRDHIVFEATSGNFGISLGQLTKLHVPVVVLVSRKLQEGVLAALEASGAKTVNLDVDICPVPGVQNDPNLVVAKVVTSNIRERLLELGLDPAPFDASRARVEELLARQDVINLAKALAEAYSGFCPAQYENELNVLAHETVTGPEIEQQLSDLKLSASEFEFVCAFGTGGTSTGLSRFVQRRYGRKAVHVIFPQEGQDVAGIRTRSKAAGLPFYQPDAYAGLHDVDFLQARRLMTYLAKKKRMDIGESSALVLYAVLQMVNFGIQGKFVIILADGISKYEQSLGSSDNTEAEELQGKLEVTLEQAKDHIKEYEVVIWTHPGFIPNEEGKKVLLAALHEADASVFEVATPMEVARAVSTRQVPTGILRTIGKPQGRVLLVCMSGNNSLKMAKLLSEQGIRSQSLVGGISNVAKESGKSVVALVTPAA